MANIRKTFNFRNGVQVDEDNFIVNANGLVGIGTSVPSEFLDVRGTTKVVGLITASDLHISGIATVSHIKVGTAISITGSGIAASQFYGDGSKLTQLPTSQWLDVDVGLGYTSIYSAGSVGVGTTDPRDTFQVGGNPAIAGKKGVGINTIGNIRASGIITATSFVGAIAGPVTGDVTGDVTGNVTGNLTGNVTGNIDGLVNVTGVSTFNDDIQFKGGSYNVTWDKSDNALEFEDNAKLRIGASGLQLHYDGKSLIDDFGSGGLEIRSNPTTVFSAYSSSDQVMVLHSYPTASSRVEMNYAHVKKVETTSLGLLVSGGIEANTSISVGGLGTVFTASSNGKVGIGTSTAEADLHILKPQGTSVKVNADSGIPNIKIGIGATANQGCLRFNNEPNSFDVVNLDTGDLNFILDGANNNGVGNFTWNDVTAERMRLTYDGKLGINEDDPAHQLHVVGTSTVTSNAWVGGNLDVKGNVSVGGTITGTLVFTDAIQANINKTTGVSTVGTLNIINGIGFNNSNPQTKLDFLSATAAFNSIGIGTTNPGTKLDVRGNAYITNVGVNTNTIRNDASYDVGNLQVVDTAIELFQSDIKLDTGSRVGCGTVGDIPQGLVDLRIGGSTNFSGPWVWLPQLTTTQRNSETTASASGISTGAMIYNTTSDRIEVFLPSAGAGSANVAYWVGIATVA
jgi:hypothetical protein